MANSRSRSKRLSTEIWEDDSRGMGGGRVGDPADADWLCQDATKFVPSDACTAGFELSGHGGPVKFCLIALPAT